MENRKWPQINKIITFLFPIALLSLSAKGKSKITQIIRPVVKPSPGPVEVPNKPKVNKPRPYPTTAVGPVRGQ